MHVYIRWQGMLAVLAAASAILLYATSAHAQTAACCIGDQCDVLEQTPCEDGGGLWLGDSNPPISDCSSNPCATGACCLGAGCYADFTPVASEECEFYGGVFYEGVTCDGLCETNDNCEDALTVCENNTPDADVGYCDNDDGIEPGTVCSVSAQDCYDGSPCISWAEDAYRCLVPTDNRLATTDGPPAAGACLESGEDSFRADIWYAITAPCAGALVISMCNAAEQRDSMLAVFGDHSAAPSCPGSSNDNLLVCNDDFCAPVPSPSAVQTLMVEDANYMIRVGSYSTFEGPPDVGRGELNIGFLCYPPPVPPRLPTEIAHQAPKNRYVTIDATTNQSFSVAYEVSLTSMKRCNGDDRRVCIVNSDCPNVCDNDDDLQCSDNSICGEGTCVPTGPCVEHSDVGNVVKYIDTPFANTCVPLNDCTDQWFANLVDTPIFRVWTENTLHIAACEIVPAAVYAIRATYDGIAYSDSLTIGTIPKPNVHYADCVGPVAAGKFSAPDGFVNVADVQAYLISNQGGASAPHTTWVDLHSSSAPVVPQQILNVGDLQTIKFGFLGQTYTETPGHENPGDCP